MADTRVQVECEDWIRREWMPAQYGQPFFRERLPLTAGGVFDFDAVSADRSIAATISTSGAKTASGKLAVGKMHKLRADMLFLIMCAAARRLMILTEPDMYEQCIRERTAGRVPLEIEFALAIIPDELRLRLSAARAAGSAEVSPGVE